MGALNTELSKKYNLFFIDLPGFGQSKFEKYPHLLNSIDKTISLLMQKYSPPTPLTLIAHSLGDAIAINIIFNNQQLQIDTFINIDGLLHTITKGSNSLSFVDDFENSEDSKSFIINKFSGYQNADPFLTHYLSNISATPAPVLQTWARFSMQLLANETILQRYINLQCNKVYIYGESTINKESISVIKKENLSNIQLQMTGHWPWLQQPVIFWEKINSYLK